jgi:uncharacterized membrane protein
MKIEPSSSISPKRCTTDRVGTAQTEPRTHAATGVVYAHAAVDSIACRNTGGYCSV